MRTGDLTQLETPFGAVECVAVRMDELPRHAYLAVTGVHDPRTGALSVGVYQITKPVGEATDRHSRDEDHLNVHRHGHPRPDSDEAHGFFAYPTHTPMWRIVAVDDDAVELAAAVEEGDQQIRAAEAAA